MARFLPEDVSSQEKVTEAAITQSECSEDEREEVFFTILLGQGQVTNMSGLLKAKTLLSGDQSHNRQAFSMSKFPYMHASASGSARPKRNRPMMPNAIPHTSCPGWNRIPMSRGTGLEPLFPPLARAHLGHSGDVRRSPS